MYPVDVLVEIVKADGTTMPAAGVYVEIMSQEGEDIQAPGAPSRIAQGYTDDAGRISWEIGSGANIAVGIKKQGYTTGQILPYTWSGWKEIGIIGPGMLQAVFSLYGPDVIAPPYTAPGETVNQGGVVAQNGNMMPLALLALGGLGLVVLLGGKK